MSTADDARTLVRLLWRGRGEPQAPRRGPRQRVTVDEIVGKAITLADERGLAAVSMRTLAAELGVGPMTLYTYVPTRDVLVALMVDQVAGDPMPGPASTIRESLAEVARHLRADYLAHPWLIDANPWRQVLGPHRLARYERQLELLEPLDVSDLDRDHILGLLSAFVTGNAREALAADAAVAESGMTDVEWWEAVAPELDAVIPEGEFPLADRVGTVAGEHHQAPGAPDEVFDFGLARLLDGLAPLIGDA